MVEIHDVLPNAVTILMDRHIAATRGDRRALSYGDKHYTFHDVAALMNRAGNMLRELAVARGQRVLIAVPPSPALVASLLGAMKIGAVPMVCRCGAAELRPCLEAVQPAVTIIHETLLPTLGDVDDRSERGTVVVVGRDAAGHASFLDLVRQAPSSLRTEAVGGAAPAVGICVGAEIRTVTHAELETAVAGASGDGLGDWDLLPMLRALANGERTALAAPA